MHFCECRNNVPCEVCINKREMAQMFKNVVLRMRLARLHGDSFIFTREDQDVSERIMMEQWMMVNTFQLSGSQFEDVEYCDD
jgi:hypothetical protein